MKKIYILASAMVLASVSYGQISKSAQDAYPTKGEESKATTKLVKKATPGDVFWYEDFANGVGGNAVDGSGNPIAGDIFWTLGDNGTGYANVWQQDFDGPNGSYESGGPLLSESASNGWMIFDANQQTDIDNPGGFITIDGYLESPIIDVNAIGTANLGVEIQHSFRTCCSGSAYPVEFWAGYFDNGIGDWVWTSKPTGNTAHNTRNATLTASGYNVETRTFNVADVAANAAANTGEMKMRFHWNSVLDASNSYYMWMVDDIRVKEISLYDSQLADMFTGDIVNDFEYYAIPDAQIINYPAVIGGDIDNMGALGLTDVNMDISIDGPSGNVYSAPASTPTSLSAGASTTLWENTGFIPTSGEYGEYAVTVTATQTEADQDASNNTKTKYFAYTEFEMGHWNPNTAANLDFVNSNSDPGRVMQYYFMYENATVYGINIYLLDGATSTNTIGQFAYVGIYDAADGVTELAFQEFEVTAGMIGTIVTIMFDTPYPVAQGDAFYAGLGSYGGGDILIVARDADGDLDNSALVDINGTIYSDSGDDYVNLWFGTSPATPCDNDLIAATPDNATLADITAVCEVTSLTAPTATDNCAGTVTGTTTTSLPITSSTTVTWTYDDGNGNIATQTQNVVITDATAPVADAGSLPDLTDGCQITSLTAPTATDNCAGTVTGTTTTPLPITSSTTITWTYDDGNGNTSTQTQNVVITSNIDNSISQAGNTLSSNEADATATYQWIDCATNTDITGEINKDFSPTASGSFKVEITKGGCTVESPCFSFTFVGIESHDAQKAKIYPNPTSSSLILEVKSVSVNSSVFIRDLTGRLVKQVSLTTNKENIDVSNLNSGIYILEVVTPGGVYTSKFIKE